MKHELVARPYYFKHLASGFKTFDVRLRNKPFRGGDTVVFREWCPRKAKQGAELPENTCTPHDSHGYTGRILTFRIGFVQNLDATRAALSLLKIEALRANAPKL